MEKLTRMKTIFISTFQQAGGIIEPEKVSKESNYKFAKRGRHTCSSWWR
uniref:Uncharacterized protein n=1 Tax=Rhizophora mucronata TaxID=61149 RepID=A0A2P2PL92_RHIMU